MSYNVDSCQTKEVEIMRIAICDNELFYVKDIVERIKKYEFHDTKPTIIDGYVQGTQLLDAFRVEPYDIVFLDIELGEDMNGIEIAKVMKDIKPNCIFIFITAYHCYLTESMWLGADLFIDKPVNSELFDMELQHAYHVYKRLNRTVKFATTDGKVYIKTDDIIYLETSYGKYKLKTTKRHYYGNLKRIIKSRQQLLDYHFFPLNRSIIINFKHVKSFCFDYVTMSNDDILPLTKRIRKEFKEKYFDFVDKEM